MKLNKFAGLCKGLNEESAVLKNECTALKEEVIHVTNERDELSEEVLILRAKAAEHERERARFAELQRRIDELEKENLEAQRALQTRDAVMDELAVQLSQTLDQLEAERSTQQPKRNKFVFPIGM